jgi:uncharacterized protein YoxC
MALLRVLTLVYAAVLVAALATVLALILAYLWRIGTVLARARSSLERVAERTRPLNGAMPPLHDDVNVHVRELETAARQMATIREALAGEPVSTPVSGAL